MVVQEMMMMTSKICQYFLLLFFSHLKKNLKFHDVTEVCSEIKTNLIVYMNIANVQVHIFFIIMYTYNYSVNFRCDL